MNRVSEGVICLLSALIYYELCDDFMDEYWIAIPHMHYKVDFPNRITDEEHRAWCKRIELAGAKVSTIGRTIVDAFRLLDIEAAVKA